MTDILTTDVEYDKILRKTQLVACRIEGHEKKQTSKKKTLDPLRYLSDHGGSFTVAAYFKDEDAVVERRHVVQRSYKQFRSLHLKLLKTYPKSNLPRDLPPLRNKKANEEYIAIKCHELTQYLTQLMQIPQIKTSNMFYEFLETSSGLEDSSDDESSLLVPSRVLKGLPGTIVTVRAGQSFLVTLPLDTAGDVVSWQFTTKKHNIGFSATFEGEVVRAYSREGAGMKLVKGFYRCSIPGTCTLTWDNTYTWSKAKVLIYWADIESQNGSVQVNRQHQVSSAAAVVQKKDFAVKSSNTVQVGKEAGSDILDVDSRRMGYIEQSRSDAIHPRYLMKSSISLLSKSFVHGSVGKGKGFAHRKTRHVTSQGILGHADTGKLQGFDHRRPVMKAGSLIIERSVKFRGRNWYRKWFVLDLRKCVLRYYDSEAAARRGLSLAKLNLSSKHVSLAITSDLSRDTAPTPYMFLVRTKKHSWNICASSQDDYNEWENAISTAILASQGGRKSKKATTKTADLSAIRTDLQLIQSEDEASQSGVCTATKVNAVTTSNSHDSVKPSSRIEASDNDLDNTDDNIDDDDEESESDSDDELHEGDNVFEVVPPCTNITLPTNSQTETIGDVTELHNLPVECKLSIAVALNIVLLSVRFAPSGAIVLILIIVDWYLVLKYINTRVIRSWFNLHQQKQSRHPSDKLKM